MWVAVGLWPTVDKLAPSDGVTDSASTKVGSEFLKACVWLQWVIDERDSDFTSLVSSTKTHKKEFNK